MQQPNNIIYEAYNRVVERRYVITSTAVDNTVSLSGFLYCLWVEDSSNEGDYDFIAQYSSFKQAKSKLDERMEYNN